MSVRTRLGAFALVLVVALGAGAAIGAAIGPVGDPATPIHDEGHTP